jgi:amino acid transporter
MRNATGLVRGVSPRSAFVLQFLGAHPAYPLAFGLFFAFALFPGGSFVLAGLLTIPISLAFCYSFGLLTSMLPRTGGDYLFVTRIISPTFGLISSFCMTVAQLMSLAFFGTAVVEFGVAPGLTVIGLVSGSDTLVRWGTTVTENHNWVFAIGTVMFILGALILAGGWRITIRVQTVILAFLTLGFGICALGALFMSHHSFINDFNSFAKPYTGLPDSYNATITAAQKGGVQTDAGFSLANSIPMIGIFSSFAIYTWFAAYAGGELRRSRTTQQAHMMALSGTTAILLVVIFGALFIHTFGSHFLIAANSAGLPKGITASPTWLFLMSAVFGSTPLTVLLVACFMSYFLAPVYGIIMTVTRTIFAFAFDGLLPQKLGEVDERTRTPWWAIGITFVLTELFFIWSLQIDNFFQVLVYATLIQLISMGLVGLCAAIVPWRKPDLYRAGSTQLKFLGIPVVTIAGVAAMLAVAFLYYVYFHWSTEFGLKDKGKFLYYLIGTIAVGALFYHVARLVQRGRGTRVELAFAEIPPE